MAEDESVPAVDPFSTGTTTLVGVLNTTPDSFSDGGRFVQGSDSGVDVAAALVHAKQLEENGADVLDIGGESTRPGAESVELGLEIARTEPLIAALAEATQLPISIDTRKAAVAEAALQAGAVIVNDVSGLCDEPGLAEVAADHGAWLVVGHMRGSPETMQKSPHFDDVIAEVGRELESSIDVAMRAGVQRERIVRDPGIGFGKRLEDNLALISCVAALREKLGVPIMLGPSRKSFLGSLTGDPVDRREEATLAACAVATFLGADALRVHDAYGARRAIRIGEALRSAQDATLRGTA